MLFPQASLMFHLREERNIFIPTFYGTLIRFCCLIGSFAFRSEESSFAHLQFLDFPKLF